MDHDLADRETKAIRNRIEDLQRAANAEIKLLESKQQRAASKVERIQIGIQQMTVGAPRNGTIVYATNWRGEKKKVGDTCWRAESVLEIPDLSRMKANGEVDEVDAGKIALNQRVSIRLDAHPDDEIRGTIRFAGKTVQQQRGMSNPVKVLPVEIALDHTDPAAMRPGMRFKGTVELGRQRNALLIPRSSVFVLANGPVAYRRDLLSVVTVPLRLGRQNEKFVEVLSGLRAGDRVLVPKPEEKDAGKS